MLFVRGARLSDVLSLHRAIAVEQHKKLDIRVPQLDVCKWCSNLEGPFMSVTSRASVSLKNNNTMQISYTLFHIVFNFRIFGYTQWPNKKCNRIVNDKLPNYSPAWKMSFYVPCSSFLSTNSIS